MEDNNRYLTIDYWDTRAMKINFLTSLINKYNDFDKIFILTQNEFEYQKVFDDIVYPFLGYYIENKGLNVELITSIHESVDTAQKFNGLNIHYWDTYWLTKTYAMLKEDHNTIERFQQKSLISNKKYHYIMMNNRAHPHRALMLDMLARENLLQFGAISWHATDEYLLTYKFQWFDGNKIELDSKYLTPTGGQYSIPSQYYESYFQLISESTPDLVFFSEKVSTALILGKPFLISAAPGIHKYLNERLGFELYTEIFDYSFDEVIDINSRYSMIADNFNRISKYSLNDLSHIESLLAEKVRFNQNRVIEIVDDTDFMPAPIREYFDVYKKSTVKNRINSHLCPILDSISRSPNLILN